MKVIINSPSLDPKVNVSGISAVTQFIISNNKEIDYIHFEVGPRMPRARVPFLASLAYSAIKKVNLNNKNHITY